MGIMRTTKEMEYLSPEQRQEAEELFSKGLSCAEKKYYTDAKNFYEKAAAYGHSAAQNNLGVLYGNGYGVYKNSQKAFELYLESARHGNIIAMRNLAIFYGTGTGTEKNFDAAVSWLETAAEQQDHLACNMLAKAYDNYPHKDEKKKIYWHKKAAEFGNADSMFFLGEYYKKDTNNKNLALAKDYFEQATKTGNYEMKPKVAQALEDLYGTDLYVEKKIGETDVKYNICTFGAGFHVGFGVQVTIRINGREYHCKTHNSVKGRIDGMKALYADNGIKLGDVLKASYSSFDKSINLTKL